MIVQAFHPFSQLNAEKFQQFRRLPGNMVGYTLSISDQEEIMAKANTSELMEPVEIGLQHLDEVADTELQGSMTNPSVIRDSGSRSPEMTLAKAA
jgi:hypothetical protein